ncbi:UNVERIFIED_CONTAM: hypothetical protein H355_009795, partial [Colinus virginianus]
TENPSMERPYTFRDFVLHPRSLGGFYWTNRMLLTSHSSSSRNLLHCLQAGKKDKTSLAGPIMSIMNSEEHSGKDQLLSMSFGLEIQALY